MYITTAANVPGDTDTLGLPNRLAAQQPTESENAHQILTESGQRQRDGGSGNGKAAAVFARGGFAPPPAAGLRALLSAGGGGKWDGGKRDAPLAQPPPLPPPPTPPTPGSAIASKLVCPATEAAFMRGVSLRAWGRR